MPRERTKGDRIQVQLPLETDAAVRATAANKGTSPAAVVEGIVVKYAELPATNVTRLVDPRVDRGAICQHPKARITVHPSGTARCDCGAVRGVGGEWR